jgi:hypothetical protein
MATARDISIGDLVELLEPTETAPAGARGGITDLLDDGMVIVELTTFAPEPILDRIVVVKPSQLRFLADDARQTG